MPKKGLAEPYCFNFNIQRGRNKQHVAESGETKAAAEGDPAVTTKALNADVTDLAGLHQDCMTKDEDVEVETTSSGEELKSSSASTVTPHLVQFHEGAPTEDSPVFNLAKKVLKRSKRKR